MPPDRLRPLVLAEKARRSLLEFVRQAWALVEPSVPYIANWHVDAVCKHLEAVGRGEITQLVINIPPGHMKSLLVSVFWPAWMWTHRPGWQAIFSSYSAALALRDSVRCRRILESEWYVRGFSGPGGWRLNDDENSKGLYTNTAAGSRQATSVGGGGTGFRANAIVTDDPINALEAPSKLVRDEANEWWDKTMSSRLNDLKRDAKVIVQQRLHEDDLSGHVLARGGYEHLCLPSEFDPARRTRTFIHVERSNGHTHTAGVGADDAHGRARVEFWADPRTEPGELLFPALFSAATLGEAKVVLGPDGYAGQHDQLPTPVTGGMFRKSWWRFWRHKDAAPLVGWRDPKWSDEPARELPALTWMIISVDCSFKKTATSDFVAMQVWGAHKADRYLLAQVHGRLSFTETVKALRELCRAWPKAAKKLVEDAANGAAVIDTLQSEIPGIVAVRPEGGKEARASAIQPQVASGNVFLPEGGAFVPGYIEEMGAFPRGKNDDQVDATSQALLDLSPSSDVARLLALSGA